jgi:hypothetical protein
LKALLALVIEHLCSTERTGNETPISSRIPLDKT